MEKLHGAETRKYLQCTCIFNLDVFMVCDISKPQRRVEACSVFISQSHQINHIEQKHIDGYIKKRSLKICLIMVLDMARIDNSQS